MSPPFLYESASRIPRFFGKTGKAAGALDTFLYFYICRAVPFMLPARAVFSAKFRRRAKIGAPVLSALPRPARRPDGRRGVFHSPDDRRSFILCYAPALPPAGRRKLQFYAFFIFIFLSRVYMHALLDIRGDWVYNNSRLFCRRAEDGAPPGAKYIRSARERNVL